MSIQANAHEPRPRGVRFPTIGLTQFGIPLGVSGLAGAWTAAQGSVNATEWVADILWIIGGIFWVLFSAAYAVQKVRGPGSFEADLKHPIIGPFTAYVPVIGALLMTHFGQYIPGAAPWIVWFLVVSSLLVAAQLFAHWLVGDLSIDDLHPGYFLPVVAAPFVGSIALSSIHATEGATAAFGIGLFFWLVVGTIVTARLITRGQLPDAVKPTLSVLLVPPAVGGIAWLFLSGGKADAVGYGFLGVVVILLAVELVLVPLFLKLPFSQAYWTFTFPIASTTNFSIRWFAASPFPGSIAATWVVLGIATVLITAVGVATIVSISWRRQGSPVQPG